MLGKNRSAVAGRFFVAELAHVKGFPLSLSLLFESSLEQSFDARIVSKSGERDAKRARGNNDVGLEGQ